MAKIMILSPVLSELLALEKILKEGGYEVCALTGYYGVLAKFDFEKPDILIVNTSQSCKEVDAVLNTVIPAPCMSKMVSILVSSGESDSAQSYCRQMGLNGYFISSHGFDGLLEFLNQFLPDKEK